ncbi:MAG: phage tail tape measure protein [Candidatus Limnocylindrales bacterium]
MSTIGELLIRLGLDPRGVTAGLALARGELGTFSKSMSGATSAAAKDAEQSAGSIGGSFAKVPAAVGLAGAAVAAITAGIAGESIKAAATFQSSMALIQTQAHASAGEVSTMTQALLQLAPSVGTGPDELAAGLFHLESAGFRGATALNALKIAAEGARIGHADLESVTNALDAVLVAGGSDAKDMSGSMGELNAIVGAGDMQMQDLADAMGTGILATAHTFGLSLKDVGGALAVMGDNNIRGADAATKLRMSISLMGAPSGAAAKALAKIGLSAVQMNEDMRRGGLTSALTDLQKHLNSISFAQVVKQSGQSASFVKAHWDTVLKAVQAQDLTHAFGGGKSSGTIQLLLNQLTRLQGKVADIGVSGKEFDSDWVTTTQTAAQKSAELQASISSMGDAIGGALLPAVSNLASAILPVVQGIADWMAQNPGLAAAILGIVGGLGALAAALAVLGPIFGVIGAAIGAIGAVLASPILLPIIAIVAAITLVVTHFKEFSAGVGIVVNFVAGIIGNLVNIILTIVGAVGQVIGAILGIPGAVVGWVGSIVGQALSVAGQVVSAVVGFAGNVVSTILSIPIRVLQWELAIAQQAVSLAGKVIGAVVGFAGTVVSTILGLPGRAAAAWINIGGQVVSLAGKIIGTVTSLVGQVVSWFLSIPGKLLGIVGAFVDLAGKIVSGFLGGLASLPGKVGDLLSKIPGVSLVGDIAHNVSGALPHFALGTDFVPADMIALIHQGEMILPPDQAGAMRTAAGRMAGPGASLVARAASSSSQAASTDKSSNATKSEVTMLYQAILAALRQQPLVGALTVNNPEPETAGVSVANQLRAIGQLGLGSRAMPVPASGRR